MIDFNCEMNIMSGEFSSPIINFCIKVPSVLFDWNSGEWQTCLWLYIFVPCTMNWAISVLILKLCIKAGWLYLYRELSELGSYYKPLYIQKSRESIWSRIVTLIVKLYIEDQSFPFWYRSCELWLCPQTVLWIWITSKRCWFLSIRFVQQSHKAMLIVSHASLDPL